MLPIPLETMKAEEGAYKAAKEGNLEEMLAAEEQLRQHGLVIRFPDGWKLLLATLTLEQGSNSEKSRGYVEDRFGVILSREEALRIIKQYNPGYVVRMG